MSARLSRVKVPASEAKLRAPAPILVWDPIVRIFHWTVVLGVLLNYFWLEGGKMPHRYAGYVVAGVLGIRVMWGFVGSRHARFADFVVRPRTMITHLAAVFMHRDRRYVGHNPAGGMMVLALMTLLAGVCLTGWMQGLDAFWGVLWVQTVHKICANAIVWLAALHVLAALAESFLHRENLILSMITGRKRPARGTDIDHADSSGGG